MRNKLLMVVDFLIMQFTFLGGAIFLQENAVGYSVVFSYSVIFLTSAIWTGIYKVTIRYFGVALVKSMLLSHTLSLLPFLIFGGVERLVLFVSIISFCLMIGVRVCIREFLFTQRSGSGAKTLVYGAGDAGIQFVTAVMQGNKYNVCGYIDDNKALHNSSIHGRDIYSSTKINQVVQKMNVDTIVLAMPSITTHRKKQIVDELVNYDVRIATVPKFQDIVDGTRAIGQVQEMHIEDLLGRDAVPPDNILLRGNIDNKTVLVTGAGGSIGSEICRQISSLDPLKIILFDVSEPSLFAIEQELIKVDNLDIECILGSVLDDWLLGAVFKNNSVDTVFHAAAYKHVPMVESNPLSGFVNNVIGTKKVLEATIQNECSAFILISTDKAVRPANIMGATKRLSELLCQGFATKPHNTRISMVRFGNVLGSSGSVVPTFRRQIQDGDPLTLTHKDITRYFMTIPEAAQLVIQSASLSKGGDIFLLDMGEPVRIFDLAERLIKLSGRRLSLDNPGVTSKDNLFSQIKITGLRPGEKLYEELLIDQDVEKTVHQKIMRAKEPFLELEKFMKYLAEIQVSLEADDIMKTKILLEVVGTGYKIQE